MKISAPVSAKIFPYQGLKEDETILAADRRRWPRIFLTAKSHEESRSSETVICDNLRISAAKNMEEKNEIE